MSSKPPSARWKRIDAELAKLGAIMRDAGFAIDGDDPVLGYGLRDRTGRWRRLHAHYPSGWRATLVFYADGSQALSYALRLVTKAVVG